MPATKAPSASDSPACSVIHASPSVISSTLRMNNSCERRRATMCSHRRSSHCPPTSSSVRMTVAFSSASPSALARCSGSLVSAGTITSSGTTARSWNSRMPTMRRPCSESSSRRSASSFITIAVELMASAPPSAKAAGSESANTSEKNRWITQPSAITAKMVSSTCAPPRPNTMRRMLRRRGSENSRPIENIRNTTPNSAR